MTAQVLRLTFSLVVLFSLPGAARAAEGALKPGPARYPLAFAHFPDRVHAFVWRNWQVVEPARIARLLGTSAQNVTAMAESMGLPPALPIPPQQKSPGYFFMTILRRNWALVPGEQLPLLLDTSMEDLVELLHEDIANWSILGSFKPECEPLRYQPPNEQTRRRAAQIKRIVREHFGEAIRRPGQPRFDFIRRLSRPHAPIAAVNQRGKPLFAPRFVCSCLKVIGDTLVDPQLDMYPEGLLQRMAEVGVDGVWLYGELRKLASGGKEFPEFGAGHQTRQANLRKLVARAKRYGIGVYLYINEPRAMPGEFFEGRPQMAGARQGGKVCMCTSNPAVRRWIADALAEVFTNVPDLAGVFTITASENLTNCASRGGWRSCPRCKHRGYAQIIAEVNAAIETGVHRGKADARVIVWDWGWRGHGYAPEVIARLPKSVWLMSVSEWSKPIERGGVKTQVGEYSLSAVGPGPRATRHWQWAKEAGLKTVAKVQLNTSWELGAVAYLPVMDLVATHCHNLASAGVDGMMLGWTLGGYPSPNLEVAHRFSRAPIPSIDQVLDEVARDRFGPQGAPHARKAWTALSRAFGEYPYHIAVLYTSPVQTGPANLLYPVKTGYAATMTGFPYDNLASWRGPYPPEVFAAQFGKVAAGWQSGLIELQRAVEKTPAQKRPAAEAELIFARAARLHFQSVANQTRFILARDALADTPDRLSLAQRRQRLDEIERIVKDEIALAREMFTLTQLDSMLGFESFCQYFYLPLDLVEKVVNCRYVLDSFDDQGPAQK